MERPERKSDRMNRVRGFTLLELLVAMAIVAIIGVMALSGLSEVINQQSIARVRADRWREVQFAMRVIAQDLAQMHPRVTREELGQAYQPSVLADPSATYALEFSRAGWSNPAGLRRGTVLRVAYEWDEDVLYRLHWPVADRTLATPPLRVELLTGVEAVEVRFLDATNEWHLDWPPLNMLGPDRLTARPRAVEFEVQLENIGSVWRVVETGA
jgi:general secretion pathway protein J